MYDTCRLLTCSLDGYSWDDCFWDGCSLVFLLTFNKSNYYYHYNNFNHHNPFLSLQYSFITKIYFYHYNTLSLLQYLPH